MTTPKVQFASPYVFCDITEEKEEIYQDEIEDGLAACAEEQAKLWAEAAKEDPTLANASFVDELKRMTSSYKGYPYKINKN